MLNYDLDGFFNDFNDNTSTDLQFNPNFNIPQDFEIQTFTNDSFSGSTNFNINLDYNDTINFQLAFEPAKTDNIFFETQDFRGLKLPPAKHQSDCKVKPNSNKINISDQLLSIIKPIDSTHAIKDLTNFISIISNANDTNNNCRKKEQSLPKINQSLKSLEELLKKSAFYISNPLLLKKNPSSTISSSLNAIDDGFEKLCLDRSVTFNPRKIGFIPRKFWVDKDLTFGELVNEFFKKKNNANSRFYHKLFNALKMSTASPLHAEFIGVEWVSENILKVDKKAFARLLGIKTIDGSLFHQQGNFPSHGFIEIGAKESIKYLTERELVGVDFEQVRLLIHSSGIFVRSCTEEDIERCKWMPSKKRL